MKLTMWTLITALVLWTSAADVWVPDAMALSVGDTTIGDTSTDTKTMVSIMPSVTNTATATTVTQLQHQNDADNLNKQGDDSSTSLGLAAIAAGMAMVAAGMAMMASPPTAAAGAALVAAGMMLIAAGMAALAAASNMNKNANKAGQYANNLGPTPGVSSATNTSIGSGDLTNNGSGNPIKIDPSLARKGKVAEIMKDFESKTGMSGDDLVNGLNNGVSPMGILANSSKVGKSEADLQKMMDKATANNAPLSAADVMGKLGLSTEDLAKEGAYGAGGGERTTASASPMADFDTLFGKNNADAAAAASAVPIAGTLSPDVQAALDRNGITSRTIFEMVHTTYQRKMPLMFGVKREQIHGVRPLYDLKGTTALDL
ncbi:MAG: hypothetical protein ACXWQO_03730 [Bdellovibrionota bacterium]